MVNSSFSVSGPVRSRAQRQYSHGGSQDNSVLPVAYTAAWSVITRSAPSPLVITPVGLCTVFPLFDPGAVPVTTTLGVPRSGDLCLDSLSCQQVTAQDLSRLRAEVVTALFLLVMVTAALLMIVLVS